MKVNYCLVFALIIFLGHPALFAQRLPTQIEQAAEEYVSKRRNHALVVSYIDGDSLTTRGFGQMSSVQEFTPDEETIFEIGGVSSVFTSTLMMLESNDGKFYIDDPINQYLPEDVKAPGYQPFICRYVSDGGLVADDIEQTRMICEIDPTLPILSISFCDLAAHTSGLSNAPRGLYSVDPLKHIRQRKDPFVDYTREQLYENLYRDELSVPPGSVYMYSNSGMALLGNLLADMNETSFDSLLFERIAEPLGLSDTRVLLTNDQEKRHATGHTKSGKITGHWHFDAMAPAGGIHSSAADLSRFVQANLITKDKKLKNAFEQTHQPRIDLPKRVKKRETSGGYGWYTSILPASNLPVTWISGSTGGFSTFVGMLKDLNVGVVILSNSANEVTNMGFDMLQTIANKQRNLKVKKKYVLDFPVNRSYNDKNQSDD